MNLLNLFGFNLIGKKKKVDVIKKKYDEIVNPVEGDMTASVVTNNILGDFYSTQLSFEANIKDEADLINKYREMALYPEIENAIDDIVNESVILNDINGLPVSLDLSELKLKDMKKKLIEEFNIILQLLDFNNQGDDIFRRFYIDGRLYYLNVIDVDKPKLGIQSLQYIDPRKIKKKLVYENARTDGVLTYKVLEEFYLYSQKGFFTSDNESNVKLNLDTITFIHSGLYDFSKQMILSYLHKSIKPLNQLKMLEDSLIIYRLARAPERLVFEVEVGNLSKENGEQYIQSLISKYKNKMVYDASTGEVKTDKKFMSMLEDYWIPKRNGDGTQISSIGGNSKFYTEMEDIDYFKHKLYKALNIPSSRFESDTGFELGRATEISRDEVKFNKFINKIKKQFSNLFSDLLKKNLILKGILTVEEWEDISQSIKYNFAVDNYFAELKDLEIERERLSLLDDISNYEGEYYSKAYIRNKVLRQNTEQQKQIAKEIEEEKNVSSESEDGNDFSKKKRR